jgi:V/A-type H+-transporting ATPase subunit K
VGLLSAIHQARVSIASINLISKRSDQLSKAMVLPAMVETYAILALLVSLIAVFNVGKIAL